MEPLAHTEMDVVPGTREETSPPRAEPAPLGTAPMTAELAQKKDAVQDAVALAEVPPEVEKTLSDESGIFSLSSPTVTKATDAD